MEKWIEIDAAFRELQPAIYFYRLDYQWGAAGVYYRLAGGGVNDCTRRFETLARIAGMKLSELPPGTLHQDVMTPDNPTERWYEALKHHAGSFQHELAATQVADDGTPMGHIFSGTIYNVVSASGVLALQLSTVPIPAAAPPEPPAPPQPAGMWSRANGWLKREADERGLIWVVAGGIAGLVLAALALL
jgi:hypothetical protein